MIEHGAEDKRKKTFEPTEELRDYLQKRLKLTRDMEKIHAAGEEYSDEIESRLKSLGSRKVGILDKFVFPAMADLFYFFQEISKHPELQELFENDVKDLLGVKRYNPKSYNYGFVFSNLIASILMIKQNDASGKQKKKEDFRLILLHILQEVILLGVQEYLPDILKDRQRFEMMLGDMSRAAAWTSMIAYPAKDEYDLKDKERYKKDIENKSPHRVFPFINV